MSARSAEESLLFFAAEAHRRKWALEDDPRGFDALHRLGNELTAAVLELRATATPNLLPSCGHTRGLHADRCFGDRS